MSSAGVILAAGSSSRMGPNNPKQLLLVEGRPLLERVVAQANRSLLDDVLVVLGSQAERIRSEVHLDRARVVVNPDYALGMSSSLKAGLHALEPGVERVVVILGDQPAVDAALLDQLLELQASSGLPAAALSFDGLLHPPVVMERPLWGDLESLEGDVGCRRLIRARPELVAVLPVRDAGGHPVDIDTPEDYVRLLSVT